MGGVCLLSHMGTLPLVLLAVFFASVNNDILFSIYLLFNTFIIINVLLFIWKIYLFFFLREGLGKLISIASVDMPFKDEVYNAFSYL